MKRLGIIVELTVACAVILCFYQSTWAQRPSQPSSHSSSPALHSGMHGRTLANQDPDLYRDEPVSLHSEMSEFCEPTCCSPVQHFLDWSRCDLVVGGTAFSNASNFLTTGTSAIGQTEGSFGFQEGFNLGNCVPGLFGGQLGGQIGLRAIQAQLNGNVAGGDVRHQLFVTGGLFRRVDYGVQGGLVVDYLRDDWLAAVDLTQLRGELSFALSACHDAGFRMTSSLNTAATTVQLAGMAMPTDVRLSALDTYRFFYRCGLGEEGRSNAELNVGFTEEKDALLGLTLSAPLHGAVGLSATGTYLIPRSDSSPAYAFESWNLGMAVVWTPGRPFGLGRDYYRPMFDVADNGALLTRRP